MLHGICSVIGFLVYLSISREVSVAKTLATLQCLINGGSRDSRGSETISRSQSHSGTKQGVK